MRVAAVSTIRNECDIIGATLTHLYSEGIANVYIADGMSTDGTRDVLAGFPCKVYDDTETCHRQPYWIARLAEQAFEDGADWIIPFDADEFVYAPEGINIAERLGVIPENVTKLFLPMYHHYTWEEREQAPKPIPKVAFRAHHHPQISNGNHDVAIAGASIHGALAIRELQYRGEDHFVRKVRERIATIDPALPSSEGEHHNRFASYSDDELREWWRQGHPFWGQSRTVVHDPIPSKFRVGQCIPAS